MMPKIISSTSLRNEYNEVSSWCHESSDPAFVTKNGAGDLAVMSIDAYDELSARAALYDELLKGRADVQKGRVRPARDAIADLRSRLGE